MNYKKHNALVTAKMAIDAMSAELGLKLVDHNLNGFAGACYDNSVTELVTALKMKAADKIDCDEWKITPTEWRESIKMALEARLYRDKEEIEELRKSIANE